MPLAPVTSPPAYTFLFDVLPFSSICIVSYLFKTNAIRFCEENKPFWYTSGKIGPYFINTHFVYGNEEDAVKLSEYTKPNKDGFSPMIIEGKEYTEKADAGKKLLEILY